MHKTYCKKCMMDIHVLEFVVIPCQVIHYNNEPAKQIVKQKCDYIYHGDGFAVLHFCTAPLPIFVRIYYITTVQNCQQKSHSTSDKQSEILWLGKLYIMFCGVRL